MALPTSLALVLRDRTRANADEALAAAVDDLVALGAYAVVKRRRGLRTRTALERAAAPPALPEPLAFLDGLLAQVPRDADLEATARWLAKSYPRARGAFVQRGIAWLLAEGLLAEEGEARQVAGLGISGRKRVLSPAGEAALDGFPPRPPRAQRREAQDGRRPELPGATLVGTAFWVAAQELPEYSAGHAEYSEFPMGAADGPG